MINASDAINTAKDTAKVALGTASGAAKTAVGETRSAVLDATTAAMGAATAAMGFFKLIGDIGLDDVLGVVGLMRKRSPLASLAIFGGGLVVGAGVAMLVTPVSGRELRGTFLRGLGMLRGRVEDQTDQIQEKVGEVAGEVKEKATEIAGEVKEKAASLVGQDATEPTAGAAEGEEDGRRGRRRHNQNTHLS